MDSSQPGADFMKTVLVTGANGLLGGAVLPLLAADHQVIALARTPLAPARNIRSLAVDLSRPLDPSLLPERIDTVLYLAQSSQFRDFPGGAADVRQLNVDQPLALIEEARARGATNFVYASSGSVYAPADTPLDESCPTAAEGFYAASKLAAELMLRPFGAIMSVTSLRFFFIYGRRQKRDMLLPRLVESVRNPRSVSLQGQDGLHFNPIHVDDAARATIAAQELDGAHTINVAGPETVSIRQVCELAGEAMGESPRFSVDSESRSPLLVADVRRMEALLGPAKVRFKDAISELL